MEAARGREHLPSSTVLLNVYDIVPYNDVLVPWGMGVHHTGIEVHGMEIAFGRCVRGSGVFECQPKRCPGHKFREQLVLGTTPYSQGDVEQYLLWLIQSNEDASAPGSTPGRMMREAETSRKANRDEDDDDDDGDDEYHSGQYSPVDGRDAGIAKTVAAVGVRAPTEVSTPKCSSSPSDATAPTQDDAVFWEGQRYHLLRNNCNHFSSFLAGKLLPVLPSPPYGSDTGGEVADVTVAVGRSTKWHRGVPSDMARYETGRMELVPCYQLGGGIPPLIPPLHLRAAGGVAKHHVLMDALVPLWTNRLSAWACAYLPATFVDKLEALDRQAQTQ